MTAKRPPPPKRTAADRARHTAIREEFKHCPTQVVERAALQKENRAALPWLRQDRSAGVIQRATRLISKRLAVCQSPAGLVIKGPIVGDKLSASQRATVIYGAGKLIDNPAAVVHSAAVIQLAAVNKTRLVVG